MTVEGHTPVDDPSIGIAPPVPRNCCKPGQEFFLDWGSCQVTCNLQSPCREAENLDSFAVGDVIKEPGTAGLHGKA